MESKFLRKVKKTETCWEWTGRLDIGNYGRFSVGGKWNKAHRVAFQLWKGVIPDGHVIRHICNNTKCVNPDHLVTGTQKDNVADMLRTNPPVWRRGEKNGQSKLTEQDVSEIRQWLEFGFPQKQIADAFGVGQATISGINTKKIWNTCNIKSM